MSEEKPPSRVLRQQFEQEFALPLARAMFELEPRCQSVLVTIGQYWCDEATDAVHSEVIACDERDPTWPLAGQARPGAIGDAASLAAQLESDAKYSEEPGGLSEVQYGLFTDACRRAFGKEYLCFLDENSDMIVAFASYCREVSDQEQPSWRSHTPYGLIRRPLDGESPTFEVLGQMYRPQWEDRWDVLEKDGIISDGDDGPAGDRSEAPSSDAAPMGLPGARPKQRQLQSGPPVQLLAKLLERQKQPPPVESAATPAALVALPAVKPLRLKYTHRLLLFALLIGAALLARRWLNP